jgi:hypothetical protein
MEKVSGEKGLKNGNFGNSDFCGLPKAEKYIFNFKNG